MRPTTPKDLKVQMEPQVPPTDLFYKPFIPQFLTLLAYLRHAPKGDQSVLIPYIYYVSRKVFRDQHSIQKIAEELNCVVSYHFIRNLDEGQKLFYKIIGLLDLQKFFDKFSLDNKNLSFFDFNQGQQQPEPQNVPLMPQIAHPQFYQIEQRVKLQGQQSIGQRFQAEDSINSQFFNEPRYQSKLNEMVHLTYNVELKGDIGLLEYYGNLIVGDRVWAVVRDSYFEIWQKVSTQYPENIKQVVKSLKHRRKEQQQKQRDNFIKEQALNVVDGENDDQNSKDVSKVEIKKKLKRIRLKKVVSSSSSENQTSDPSNESGQKFDGLQRSYRFIGHTSKITCVSFSEDELYIITGSADRTVRLWCLRLNILLATYKFHVKTIWDVHFCPSGLYLLSGAADGLMVLWKTDTPKPQRVFPHQRDIYKVQFAKNPDYVMCAGEQALLWIYQIKSSSIFATIKLDNPIINFNLGHSGTYIAMIQTDGRVTIHNIFTASVICSFYFYFKNSNRSGLKRQLITDICFSDSESDLVCVCNQHILVYNMTDIATALPQLHPPNVYPPSMFQEKSVRPYLALMSQGQLRFNFCKYTHKHLLIIGGTKYTP